MSRPADDAHVNAVTRALSRAGVPQAGYDQQRRRPVGTGFGVSAVMSAEPRAAVTLYEDSHPAGGPWDAPALRLQECEHALRKAGFQAELALGQRGLYLVAWRGGGP